MRQQDSNRFMDRFAIFEVEILVGETTTELKPQTPVISRKAIPYCAKAPRQAHALRSCTRASIQPSISA